MESVFPHSFPEATKLLLARLPSRRMRDVLERRFGLKGGKTHTLEAIGKEYRITRERVRQIEADALRHLGSEEGRPEIEPVLTAIADHIGQRGAVMAEQHLLNDLAEPRLHPHVNLFLDVGKQFTKISETDAYHRRWATDTAAVERAESVLETVVHALEARGNPASEAELRALVEEKLAEAGANPVEPMIDAHLAMSKEIRKNPYGEYGLVSWPSIHPRGVKDKAYTALAKTGKPLHFREVAEEINRIGWSRKKAYPQTVHNELIKDSRFVLVGRGLYALKEWGYESGVVRDVLVSLMENAKRPLAKDEIVAAVLGKRFVKAPTVLLNLQNRQLFRRLDDGRYTLA